MKKLDQEQDLKKEVFGETTLPDTVNTPLPDHEKILARNFAGVDSVAYSYCRRCGSLLEVREEGLPDYLALARRWEIKPHEYFTTGGCLSCRTDVVPITINTCS